MPNHFFNRTVGEYKCREISTVLIQSSGLDITTSPKMKFAIALLFCVIAAASADYYGYGHRDYGFDKPENL
jgi:hypothetical protein